jgi:hypothetical protein
MNIFLGLIPTIISLLISIIMYKKLNPVWLRLFTWFILFTILIQVVGYAYSHYYKKSNHFIFNVNLLFQYLFYFVIFYKTFEQKKIKLLILAGGICFVAYTLFNFIYKKGFYTYSTPSNTLGSILTILFCLLYFVSLFQAEEFINYFKLPMFWIATGLLFFFAGNFIYYSFIGYIIEHNLDKGGRIYWYIMVTLNLLLYCFFSIGFLSNQAWNKKTSYLV